MDAKFHRDKFLKFARGRGCKGWTDRHEQEYKGPLFNLTDFKTKIRSAHAKKLFDYRLQILKF